MRIGSNGEPQRGFTYLLLLFVLAIGGAGLAAVGERQQTLVQREREAELRFRGEAIAVAIQRYAELAPPGRPPLPKSLDELLEDRRGPRVERHLRQVYLDPFTGKADWELVYGPATVITPDGTSASTGPRGVVGVRSRSARRLFFQPPGARQGVVASQLSFIAAGQAAENVDP